MTNQSLLKRTRQPTCKKKWWQQNWTTFRYNVLYCFCPLKWAGSASVIIWYRFYNNFRMKKMINWITGTFAGQKAPEQHLICCYGVSSHSRIAILYIGHSVALPILIPPCELKLVKLAGWDRKQLLEGGKRDLRFTSVAEILTYPEAAWMEGHVVPGSQSQKDVKGQEGHLP